MTSPIYREEISSQIPEVRVLRNMGWTFLPAGEALQARKAVDRGVGRRKNRKPDEEELEVRKKCKDEGEISQLKAGTGQLFDL